MRILPELLPEPVPFIPPLLITGASGTLGRAFHRICHTRGIKAVLLSRQDMDIADLVSVEQALEQYQPWAVVNTAGYVRVDDAETDFRRCYRENTLGPAVLAAACAHRAVQLLTFSSDLVFDGLKSTPYLESDLPRPLNVYGNSKRLAERDVLTHMPAALVVRTSAFFGPWDEHNFVYHALRAVGEGELFEAADDQRIAPTYVPDLVNTSLDLLLDEEQGLWHLANAGTCTWAELARTATALAGLDPAMIVGRPGAAFGWPAARPAYSVLGSEHGALLPALEVSLQRYLHEAADMLNAPQEQIAAAS
ncbi:dTDP-4-dehydrorhamnose reductase [Hymenobacter roseosalivarius DSM 11622]|uniref:dTDP-4-dehydrorhamnose reductase n=1 Tax=Hymenobacter roseosalivarius DSM 11622 TaxID=645990 RepID=A0A1W1VTA1_9BACT|nr:SDR family oxidoreductase [Hymenobacter roseosalivarius]SMB96460.1 dTDP-4-dehydrorhamnose reductase [Hymenobacter roseosalivarius DSM 11622]